MKRALFFVCNFILISVFAVSAQNTLSISGKHSNGKVVSANDILCYKEFVEFFIQNELGDKIELNSCEWQLECLDKNSIFVIGKKSENVDEFTFSLDALDTKVDLLNEIRFGDDDTVYFQAQISCSGQTITGETFDETFPIFLNLYPSIPVIELIELKFDKIDFLYLLLLMT